MLKVELVTEKPCSVFLVLLNTDSDHVPRELSNDLQFSMIPREYMVNSFRGVSTDRLATVLKQGIDVEPTNAVIWVNDLDKALEYGGWPKIVMALDHECLKMTFVQLDANTSEDELMAVRREFPTVLKSADGSTLWCSRLREDAPQINTDYEAYSARWIPGDPWRALKGIFVFHRPKDFAEIEILRRQLVQPV
ncbi:MAG: hypothetical protein PSY14_11225 [bacterium]|nr:hypothetical protein [bacterium]